MIVYVVGSVFYLRLYLDTGINYLSKVVVFGVREIRIRLYNFGLCGI